MEIQHGKGPWAPPVSGIVPLGSTLTLVVAINDYRGNELHEALSRFRRDWPTGGTKRGSRNVNFSLLLNRAQVSSTCG